MRVLTTSHHHMRGLFIAKNMEHMDLTPLTWTDGRLRLLDQTRLPSEEVWLTMAGHQQVATAIRSLQVPGAKPGFPYIYKIHL